MHERGRDLLRTPNGDPIEKWDTALDSQAKAFLVGVREAAPLMSDGGKIVAITFAPGGRFGSWQPWVAMGAAKAAMEVLYGISPSRWPTVASP